MQGEGCQLGWRTDAETGLESVEDGCLEREATPAIEIKSAIIGWIEGQVDGLELGQLVNSRKRAGKFLYGASSDYRNPSP